jgi:hypothetical protein
MTGREHFFLMHLNSADRVDSYEVIVADTDAAAMVRAEGTLHSGNGAVEVWKHGRLIGRVGRKDRT